MNTTAPRFLIGQEEPQGPVWILDTEPAWCLAVLREDAPDTVRFDCWPEWHHTHPQSPDRLMAIHRYWAGSPYGPGKLDSGKRPAKFFHGTLIELPDRLLVSDAGDEHRDAWFGVFHPAKGVLIAVNDEAVLPGWKDDGRQLFGRLDILPGHGRDHAQGVDRMAEFSAAERFLHRWRKRAGA